MCPEQDMATVFLDTHMHVLQTTNVGWCKWSLMEQNLRQYIYQRGAASSWATSGNLLDQVICRTERILLSFRNIIPITWGPGFVSPPTVGAFEVPL